jgi:hypothetical protein
MLNLRLVTGASAMFATLSYVLCVSVGLLAPRSPFHMSPMLEVLLPAFKWISTGAFFLGLIESFLWGVYLGGGFALVYNALYRRMAFKTTQ